MKKRVMTYLLVGILLSTSVVGCAEYQAAPDDSGPISIVQVEAMPLLNPRSEGNPSAQAVAHGANDFAFRLSAALVQDIDDENFVFSPYSVWLPLAALLNATGEAYQQALLTALGASGISVADVNQAASRMLFDLTNEGNREHFGDDHRDPLHIANAIFVDHDVTLQRAFAQDFMDFFRGTVIHVDFQSPDAVDAVNTWASDHTEGLITDMIEKFDPDTVAAIANAIYFSDGWARDFDPTQTVERTFYAPSGETSAYFMQRVGRDQLYFEDETLQAIHLQFETGGSISILLPRSGDAVELLSSMTSESFGYIHRNATLREGRLLLPRFSFESTHELDEVLTALGVPLFDETTMPLTGLIYEAPAWLLSAVQKAVIEVDEQGATAAAVTVMEAAPESVPEPLEQFEMICDRPFVFVLHRQTTDGGNQILFTGVVNQP